MLRMLIIISLLILAACAGRTPIEADSTPEPTVDLFGPREEKGLIAADEISEASGLVASRQNTNVLWTHNDSGDSSRLYALDTEGRDLGVYTLAEIDPRDWEDIALGPGPEAGRDCRRILCTQTPIWRARTSAP